MAIASQTLLSRPCITAIPTCSTSCSSSPEWRSPRCPLYSKKGGRMFSGFIGKNNLLESGYTCRHLVRNAEGWRVWRADVSTGNQTTLSAKELERDAAKEALLLAIADAGGVEALTSGKVDNVGRITVSEKLLNLERLNPTPRPTTSPLLEGLWQIKWAGSRTPGVTAAKVLLGRLPSELASINSLNILILDGTAKATASLKVLNTIESTLTLLTKLTAEGPARLKEEYVEGVLDSPSVPDGNVPSQLKGAYNQLVSYVERLPTVVKDVLTGGVKVPLGGTHERQLVISYLDEEILIARDASGVPDVLYRIETTPTSEAVVTIVPEYLS